MIAGTVADPLTEAVRSARLANNIRRSDLLHPHIAAAAADATSSVLKRIMIPSFPPRGGHSKQQAAKSARATSLPGAYAANPPQSCEIHHGRTMVPANSSVAANASAAATDRQGEEGLDF